jgi:hypothetical protein
LLSTRFSALACKGGLLSLIRHDKERRQIDRRFEDGGPLFLAAKIDDQPGAAQPPRDPALVKNQFMKGLGTSRGGALGA